MSGKTERVGRGRMAAGVMVVSAFMLLAAAPAPAQGPVLSNLTWTQGPNGLLGTKIDIYYDLTSANGPCFVSAKLSKDNGATFPFDITTATGDIGAGVAEGQGRHIVWDVAADYPNEVIAQAKIRIITDDAPTVRPAVTSMVINNGAVSTLNMAATLNNAATNSPTEYMASESASFSGAAWQPYDAAPAFTLTAGVRVRTVYFKVKNAVGESDAASDTILLDPEMLPVAAGAFIMGNSSVGDDATYAVTAEQPAHTVTLNAYEVGKCMITNKQYCDVLNWAIAKGYLKTSTGAAWTGTGSIYGGGSPQILMDIARTECNTVYSGGVFSSKTRVGLPGSTDYSMDSHPVVAVSWYGSVAFCNWLSEWQGLTPCYDMNTAGWPLTVAPPDSGGYRLPTEAEWERAAAWDGSKHWIYGFTSDTLTGNDRCNYAPTATTYVNPLGIVSSLMTNYTSPVAWFDGVNVSPNGNVTTVNSVSPVGAYDMSGNVGEWCQDWYLSTYYTGGDMTNPTGPATGTNKVMRGGSFKETADLCRTAARDSRGPDKTPYWRSFRIVRTP